MKEAMSEDASRNKTPTVLIVDDNSNNIKVVGLTLRRLNYKILIATNGKDAIEMVEKIRPDLVLLDVMMPGMDGYQTCEVIKSDKKNENIPVLFLTALHEKENIVKGFEAGGVDYITKPFNPEELISRVKTHLELKHTRDKLETAMENLSQLNSLKDKMFSVIGHDLRSPLGSVKMTLEFLSQSASGSCPPEIRESLDLMIKTTEEIFDLLENLLGWGKSQTGNLFIEPERLNLNELIQSVYFLSKGNLNFKSLYFENEVPADLSVFADLNMLKLVFRNLISNAIKFTSGGGRIRVLAQPSDGNVEVAVEDNGVGIPEENLLRLFDPGNHLTTYGTNKESGSGLGLKLVHDVIARNNGDIRVESEEGKGTSFIVTLPAADASVGK
jgi:two-component system, sensor histidine kinase and response regulator